MRFLILDVFTDTPLAGNQLAVFPEADEVPEHLLQPLAREINFSETVFVYPPSDPANTARMRIFVPVAEIPFAGHPVLGTAVALAARRNLSEVRLETGQGLVPVTVRGTHGAMRQPLPSVKPYAKADGLLQALGLKRSELPVEIYDNGIRHAYIALASEEEVARLRPDATRLERFGVLGTNCFAGSGRRWKTRNFVPGAGIVEDPATGSAAGPLALHLARHGVISFGEEIEISQGVEISRPSTLYACVEGTRERVDRILVGGSAVIVARGEFRL